MTHNAGMAATADPATLELLAWISDGPRTYGEAIEVWQSHCPRHPVWEEALADGLIRVVRVGGGSPRSEVALTPRGREALRARGGV
jgi:hypothetical protein